MRNRSFPRRMLRHRALAFVAALGLAVSGLVVSVSPAQAYPDAFEHTQDRGNRGVDVLAIQHLLRSAGHDAPVDGVFDSATQSALRAFQQDEGLPVDGIAGPNTWEALTTQLEPGDTGQAVRAVQAQLNAKRDAGLDVDGEFDAATESAVRDFQQHAGIGVDGIVGPITWSNLVWHYVSPDFGGGLCDQDPDGNGNANWGTGAAIAQLERAVGAFDTGAHGEVPLGDASFEHGGDIPVHSSHEQGMDVDLWPIRTDGEQCSAGRITWQSDAYDRQATRELVEQIREAAPGHVALILFNDPVLVEEGLTTEYPNHDNHLHVRYCETVHPAGLYTC